MDINAVVAALCQLCPDRGIESRSVPVADAFVALPSDCVHAAVALLMENFDLYHLSAITGQDIGGEIELLYHFWNGAGLTLRTSLPRESPRIATLTDLIPGAAFYEREAREMLGVDFDGHPDLSSLLLPEDWDSAPPLLAETPDEDESENADRDVKRENQESDQ